MPTNEALTAARIARALANDLEVALAQDEAAAVAMVKDQLSELDVMALRRIVGEVSLHDRTEILVALARAMNAKEVDEDRKREMAETVGLIAGKWARMGAVAGLTSLGVGAMAEAILDAVAAVNEGRWTDAIADLTELAKALMGEA